MKKQVKLGLIGKNISYSFSKKYFENKFKNLMLDHFRYHLYDIDEITEIEEIFKDKDLIGLNITIPYKQKVQPYLDELSEEAEKTGAVNCIFIKNGKKIGHNTDVFGFEKTLFLHPVKKGQIALVLGNGGAAKAVQFVLEKHQIPYVTVFRKSDLNFDNLTSDIVKNHEIIIQCTPVGTFPDVENCVNFPFEGLGKNHLIIDLIYNPSLSKFIRNAAEKGSKTVNGFYMLEQQAEKSWQIWNS